MIVIAYLIKKTPAKFFAGVFWTRDRTHQLSSVTAYFLDLSIKMSPQFCQLRGSLRLIGGLGLSRPQKTELLNQSLI